MQLKQLSCALLTIVTTYCADPAWDRFDAQNPIRMRCLKSPSNHMCKDIEAILELARQTGAEQKNIDPTKSANAVERVANLPENRFVTTVLPQITNLMESPNIPDHKKQELAQSLSQLPIVAMELFAQNAIDDTERQNELISKLLTKFQMEVLPQVAVIQLMHMLQAAAEQEQQASQQRQQRPRSGTKFSLVGNESNKLPF